MAIGSCLTALSKAASEIGAYFAGNNRTGDEGRYGDLVEISKGKVESKKEEKKTKPASAVALLRFGPEFDGLHVFETLVSR